MRRGIFQHEDDDAESDRVTHSLAGLAVALLVVVASLFLVQALANKARFEDCLMAGRTTCEVVVPTR